MCVHVCVCILFRLATQLQILDKFHCVARYDGMWMDLAIFGRFWRYTSTCVAMVIEHRCKVTHIYIRAQEEVASMFLGISQIKILRNQFQGVESVPFPNSDSLVSVPPAVSPLSLHGALQGHDIIAC